MIIENGYITCSVKTGGGMVGGRPQPVSVTDSDPIPCNWKAQKWDKKGKVIDGVFTQAQFEILIELDVFDAETIHLYDTTLELRDLGEFTVQSVEPLAATGAVKITV
ncbi:MAG: hypothetical protein J6I31_08965 [Prevotella sp.]|nr:hypothetical protein [Prevotella sp.]